LLKLVLIIKLANLGQMPESHHFKLNPDEQAIIESLQAAILKLLANPDGKITFHDFMQTVLYTPGLGYYMNNKLKLGKEGDFTTAPEMSSLFGQCIASQTFKVLQTLEKPNIIEFGAGSGKLACDILQSLAERQMLPMNYYIVELSGHLKQLQYATIKAHCPEHLNRVHWVSELTDIDQAMVIANEVLDAMPIHLVNISPTDAKEYYVTYADNQWQFQLGNLSNRRLGSAIDNLRKSNDYFTTHYYHATEINLYIEPWLRNIATVLEKACILILDYGFPRREYYHPDRDQGTLMCHYRHRCHPNPLRLFGVQDITAHVDFTAVAEAADTNQLTVQGFTTLGYFLLSSGLHQKINPMTVNVEDWQNKQAIMQLTSPNEMGELFKVMQLTKNLDLKLSGYTLKDMIYRL